MTCIKKDLIQKYIDKEASREEILYVEKHIENCKACAEEVTYRQGLSRRVITSINRIVEENTHVPEFTYPVEGKNKRLIYRKRMIYSISAACILLLVFFITDYTQSKDQLHVTLINSLGPEVDANRPASEQEMVIQVIDTQGNLTEINIE